MRRRTLLTLPVLAQFRPAFAAPPPVTIRAHYECLWWSDSQMEGLRSDSPLPKTTRVKLDRWEYSDPVGVPNPDEVILVATLTAPAPRSLQLAVRTSWRIRGTWRQGTTLPPRPVTLAAATPRVEEFIIPVRRMIHDRDARRLAAIIQVDGKGSIRAELPIIGGD